METMVIDIVEYFFNETEILILKSSAIDETFILDVDKILDDKEILMFIHRYYEVGDIGGMIRDRVYKPWHSLPISSDDALDSCKWCRNVRNRTYTRIDSPDPENITIVYKEMIV